MNMGGIFSSSILSSLLSSPSSSSTQIASAPPSFSATVSSSSEGNLMSSEGNLMMLESSVGDQMFFDKRSESKHEVSWEELKKLKLPIFLVKK